MISIFYFLIKHFGKVSRFKISDVANKFHKSCLGVAGLCSKLSLLEISHGINGFLYNCLNRIFFTSFEMNYLFILNLGISFFLGKICFLIISNTGDFLLNIFL